MCSTTTIPLDLASHIHRVSAMLVEMLSDNISVVISLAPGLRAVLGRSADIEKMVTQLVGNARDALPHGGTITIAARNEPETDEVLLTVTCAVRMPATQQVPVDPI